MSNVQIFDDKSLLAEEVATQTIAILTGAIEQQGRAVWVLAGGSTPLLAYKIIAEKYHDAIDWKNITLLIGDERIGPLDGPDNNWHAIEQVLGVLPTNNIRPRSDHSAEYAASSYLQQLQSLPTNKGGLPRLDLVWLGVGNDGHTLSLFPGHDSILPTRQLVIPVHDSPKPPADRISLSLRALSGAKSAMIIASGADKQSAISAAQRGGYSPIALAAGIIDTHDGKVSWLLDRDAAPTD
ncbi:MAG: 6-phosphogluconolactonase, 6-phosphogluconolactonase [Candidatus Saccharibacteria bacterium]|nr:6-phosphogluconolactonase, 6-phosphogluconolactonase [Candidatus Saccharibacteria bacterium]